MIMLLAQLSHWRALKEKSHILSAIPDILGRKKKKQKENKMKKLQFLSVSQIFIRL